MSSEKKLQPEDACPEFLLLRTAFGEEDAASELSPQDAAKSGGGTLRLCRCCIDRN